MLFAAGIVLVSVFGTINIGAAQDNKPVDNTKWIRKAAELGDSEAQYKLGLMYLDGQGVKKDETEAVRWLRKAAEQGQPDAQLRLGWMYKKGQGVVKDETEAVKWVRKAAEQGLPEAKENLRKLGY